MCNFMSVCSDGKGKVFYFDWKIRKQILKGKLKYEMDSHTSIANHFGFKGKDEDKLNKYEFNPLTKEFKKDQINATDDSEEVKKKLLKLDFKKIMPQLVIQPIINPFNIKPPKKITKEHIKLMKQWDSVGDSVWTSVWASVWASVGDSVGDSVRDSVGDSVWDSVWASVGDSVWASVWTSVGDSVWASVWAYIGSFFKLPRKSWKYTEKIKTKDYPFEPVVKLWRLGLVASFDGNIWRLHGGPKAKVMFQITKAELRKTHPC